MIGYLDQPRWEHFTTEAVEQYLARCIVYAQADANWKAGPSVIAQLHAELRRREQAA